MKISIAGDLGSGKSSVAKYLQKQLNYSYLSTGQLQRKMAEEYGVNSLELNKLAKEDNTIDDRIDNYLIALSESDENLIIDSRLAWHFVRGTFKIYLEVNNEIAAERVLGDKGRLREPSYADENSARTALKARKDEENKRFLEKYKVDCRDLSNYDVVINTSAASIERAGDLILLLLDKIKSQKSVEKFWNSPQFVFPTKHLSLLDISRNIDADERDYENLISYQIQCVKYNDYYYVLKGHEKYGEALQNKLDFIPISLIAEDHEKIQNDLTVEQYLTKTFNPNLCKEWEHTYNFNFIKYPK